MVSSRLGSASEYPRFRKYSVENISRSKTPSYLNETNIRLLMFPVDAFTLPLEKFEIKSLCENLFGVLLNCEV